MSVAGITAENADNHPDIEKQWAVKAFHHAETYFKLMSAVGPSKLKLTPIDEEIYQDFRKTFPNIPVDKLNDVEDFKLAKSKEKWRNWIMPYENKVQDYNFGTLLRIDHTKDYTEENTMFVTRMQFYAVEIARNREGLNKQISGREE